MSEVTIHARPQSRATNGNHKKSTAGKGGPRRPNYNALHRNLLPVEVHPLPPLIPHNPLSLVTIALSYLIQTLLPPKRTTYKGYFTSATSSIHITDHETQRALWEQGFFGRGSLSRSEPTWLESRRKEGVTAEENTNRRRQERRNFKIERAKIEQAEIQKDLDETPRGTPEIPRSVPNTIDPIKTNKHDFDGIAGVLGDTPAESGPLQPTSISLEGAKPRIVPALSPKLLDLKEDELSLKGNGNEATTREIGHTNGSTDGSFEGYEEWKKSVDPNGLPTPPPTSTCSETSQAEPTPRPTKRLQRQKTVRFSPTIEAREFDLSSPVISPIKAPGTSPSEEDKALEVNVTKAPVPDDQNQEHLHISLEEAFFLSYSLGVLEIYPSPSSESEDPTTAFPTTSLLSLFRRHSYYPPRNLSTPLEPDDPFMLSYTTYHHFRSMGWVVRSGVKFGVDYLLYNRGPAFSHAEFAVIVIPSYSDAYWHDTDQQRKSMESRTKKSWWWLHGINRVQAQVHKSLVLCYVDVPPPNALKIEKGSDTDIGNLFTTYKVRDVNVKRWTPNRSRD